MSTAPVELLAVQYQKTAFSLGSFLLWLSVTVNVNEYEFH